MPFMYRVSNTNPKDVKKRGGFSGTENTTLPANPSGGAWPPGSFCAAQLDDISLTEKQIKLALTRFRPPPAEGTPFLYRLDVSPDTIVKLNQLPDQCFVGNGFPSKDNVEVIVTVLVVVAQIDVSIGGKWKSLATI